jgi:RecA/RadA recombinase
MGKLQDYINKYNKDLAGSIIKLSDSPHNGIERASTGSFSCDISVGGGLPCSSVIELFGEESVGKSLLSLKTIATVQKKFDKDCVYIDLEGALTKEWATKVGVNPEKLYIVRPKTAEKALDTLVDLVSSKEVGVIVVDSVAALCPIVETEESLEKNQMGVAARLMSKTLRILSSTLQPESLTDKEKYNPCIVIFINQTRCLPKEYLAVIDGKIMQLKDACNNSTVFSSNKVNTIVDTVETDWVEGKLIQCKINKEFCISDNHKQPVLRNGLYQELLGKNLKKGDFLIQPIIKECPIIKKSEPLNLKSFWPTLDSKHIIKTKLPEQLTEELAFFMGCYYSDGSFICDEEKSTYGIQFTENNRERFRLVKDVSLKLFDSDRVYIYKNLRVTIKGMTIYEFFKNLGLKRYSRNKVIPDIILKSDQTILKAFIRGCFFDTHNFSKEGFYFSNSNRKTTILFSHLLYYFGIFSNIIKAKNKQKSDCLVISGDDAVRFRDVIGFAEKTKQIKSNNFTSDLNARGKYDIVPHSYAKLIFDKIKNLKIKNKCNIYYYNKMYICLWSGLNISRKEVVKMLPTINKNNNFTQELNFLINNRFSEITNIKNTNFDGIDIEVSNDSTFVANQFLTHNSKIGILYGNPLTTPGGNALKFYSSVRIHLKKGDTLRNEAKSAIGQNIKFTVVKNKTYKPLQVGEFSFYYDGHIDNEESIINYAIAFDLIKSKGAWCYLDDKKFNGKEAVAEYLKKDSKAILKLKKEVIDIAMKD